MRGATGKKQSDKKSIEGESMKKIYIWGAGYYSKSVYRAIDKNQCIVAGFIDKDYRKQNKKWEGCIPIVSPEILEEEEYDYVFISVKNYEMILEECKAQGLNRDKIVPFWSECENIPFVDNKTKKIIELEEQVKNLQKDIEQYKYRLENYLYEEGILESIPVKSSEELLKEILDHKMSLCRFGDGELEIIRGKERLWYQKVNPGLSVRLKEILESKEDKIAIAISNNFGSLADYTEDAANAIREYLSGETRKEIMELLEPKNTYYDAYVSRPYIIYKDKNKAKTIFALLKKIWKNRHILIVEGCFTRMGVGNDLFADAASIRRIICPDTDAFDYYEKIFEAVYRNVYDNALVLISLGPAATVLAFDLARQGIQALDIGQLDTEYEWFLRGVTQRVEIPGKGVAELEWCRYPENKNFDLSYQGQVIDMISKE